MSWLPDDGLLRHHYNYATWCTDAPPVYHVAAMATVLSSLVADAARVIIDANPYPLHVWTMLIGKSTSDRKTTSTKIAVTRAEAIQRARVMRIYGSPEGVLQSLAANPCALIYVPEGGAFFAQRESGYWKHAREIFMDLYDYTNVFERRLVREVTRIEDPRVSILSACARPLLERYTKDTDWLGGFLARFLLIAGDPLAPKPWLRQDPTQDRHIESLLYHCMTHAWGPMAVTSAAKQAFADFADDIRESASSFPEGVHPSLNRLPEMAVRFAGLYEIADRAAAPPKGTCVVRAESALGAIALCKHARDYGIASVADLAAPSGVAKQMIRIENLIRRAGPRGLTRTELVRTTRMLARELDQILLTLGEAELVTSELKRETAKRPTTRYCHVEAMNDAQRLAEIHTTRTAWVDLSGQASPQLTGLRSVDETDIPPWIPYGIHGDDSALN